MLVPAFLIPSADGSTAVAQLVPSTQSGTQTIQNYFINSLIAKSPAGSSNNLLGVLTPVGKYYYFFLKMPVNKK